MTKVYKVVLAYYSGSDCLLSSSCTDDPAWRLFYQKHKRVVPFNGSYLYAFAELEDAFKYVDKASEVLTEYGALQVWEAQATILRVTPFEARWINYGDFWQKQLYAYEYPVEGVHEGLPGSVWCEYVELDKQIWGPQPKFRKPTTR